MLDSVWENAPPMRIKVNGVTISEVSSPKYLGARFNAEALCDEEIKTRLALARERMGKLDPLWRSRAISPPPFESAAHSVPGMTHTALRLGPCPRI